MSAPAVPLGQLPQLGQPALGLPGLAGTTGAGVIPGATPAAISQPGVIPTSPVATPATPTTNAVPTTTTPIPGVTGASGVGGTPIGSGGFTQLYGNDTGGAVTNLLNSESPTTANSDAQAIIAANAPNVAQGSATLNEGLAMSGISPSSSVSAIENANYQGQVAQQDQSELAQVNLQEQQMQQQLLESLLPGQQQRETETSGWSIFNDVAQGIGDVVGL